MEVTFRIDREGTEIVELEYEDPHEKAAMGGTAGIRMKRPAHPGGFVSTRSSSR